MKVETSIHKIDSAKRMVDDFLHEHGVSTRSPYADTQTQKEIPESPIDANKLPAKVKAVLKKIGISATSNKEVEK